MPTKSLMVKGKYLVLCSLRHDDLLECLQRKTLIFTVRSTNQCWTSPIPAVQSTVPLTPRIEPLWSDRRGCSCRSYPDT